MPLPRHTVKQITTKLVACRMAPMSIAHWSKTAGACGIGSMRREIRASHSDSEAELKITWGDTGHSATTLLPEQATPSRSIKRMVLPIRQFYIGLGLRGSCQSALHRVCKPRSRDPGFPARFKRRLR
jgi:hypothetical protein